MKIINDGLPEAVFNLINNDSYSRGDADISVTQLIDSPRVRVLYARHDHEIEVKASSLLAPTLGRAFHSAVEGANKSGTAEKRYSIECMGWQISGGVDHHEDGTITDYKTANVFKTVYAESGSIDEWEKQLNVYAHILRKTGIPVTDLKIFVLFKDWNKRGFGEALKKGRLWVPWEKAGYPEKSWALVSVPLWTSEDAKFYVEHRVKIHQAAEKDLPLCTKDEIWSGNRCKDYCAVNKFCDQHKEQSQTGLIKKELK